jgi:peptidylprolyl isomerase
MNLVNVTLIRRFSYVILVGLGEVIRGWDEGVMTMQLGEIARLTCTADYAYGASGFPAWYL